MPDADYWRDVAVLLAMELWERRKKKEWLPGTTKGEAVNDIIDDARRRVELERDRG
jgi:hypothetical protein